MSPDLDRFCLRTARATLRPWRKDEASLLLDIRSKVTVARWLGDPEPWTSIEQAHANLKLWSQRATLAVPSTCAIVPHETGIPVGSLSLNFMSAPGIGDVELSDAGWLNDYAPIGGVGDTPGEVGIGWYLHPEAVGNGWAAEAATAVLTHGLEHGVARVWAVMWAHNDASAGVCRRVGMSEVGVHVDPWYGTTTDPHSRFFIASRP